MTELQDPRAGGLNYTAHITRLMRDVVRRVPALGFIDVDRMLVFARPGRTGAEGPYATCHSLTLPDSEPGYYFWRDAATGQVTRRSEWFVTRSPRVLVGGRQIDYLFSFSLPRFVDQKLGTSRKRVLYPSGTPDWVAKLDTIVHELYHVDPGQAGLRPVECQDGRPSFLTHSPRFFEDVAAMVGEYFASGPDAALTDFLHDDFLGAIARHGAITGATFRPYPSYPRRYRESVLPQPAAPPVGDVRIEPVADRARTLFTEADLQLRRFDLASVHAPHEPHVPNAPAPLCAA
ncbi:MAG: hypothetical protein AB7H88_21160 [Vicinamibacterales bacterium]